MPLDYQQVHTRIKEIGAHARERRKALELRQEMARTWFTIHASELDRLRQKVEAAKEIDPNLRCAFPLAEHLDAHLPPPELPSEAVLIAADGSQITPDRHAQVQFGLINVGAIVMRLASGVAPQIHIQSELLFDQDLLTVAGSQLTDGMVALRRDLGERSRLYDLAQEFEAEALPVITFTDGPMELWGSREGEDARAYEIALQEYVRVLSRLQEQGVTTAGYVDKPAADLLVRLLEVAAAPPEMMARLREYRPLLGVSDRWLFGEKANPLLGPGERSAVFRLQARSERNYTGMLSLHFFYLNVGTQGHPWLARVEVPRWVVDEPDKLGLLHAVLVAQCRIMGSRPYPYLLHRAHETAVVKLEEKQQVEQMLLQELRRNEAEVDDGSNKQSAKDSGGRTSYRR